MIKTVPACKPLSLMRRGDIQQMMTHMIDCTCTVAYLCEEWQETYNYDCEK